MAKFKKNIRRILLAVTMLLIAGITLALLLEKGILWFNMPARTRYPVRGVDVSHYQGDIDWETVAAQGISFAFIKATEGSGTADECFAANWENARAAGLAVGAYHFFSFDSPAATQADNFCSIVPDDADALPPVIDLEFYRSDDLPEPDEVRAALRELLDRFRQHSGRQPIIYTTSKCYERFLEGTDMAYTLWMRSIFTAPSSGTEPAWTFWQYNPRGRIAGTTGPEPFTDLNVFRGTAEDFRAFLEAERS